MLAVEQRFANAQALPTWVAHRLGISAARAEVLVVQLPQPHRLASGLRAVALRARSPMGLVVDQGDGRGCLDAVLRALGGDDARVPLRLLTTHAGAQTEQHGDDGEWADHSSSQSDASIAVEPQSEHDALAPHTRVPVPLQAWHFGSSQQSHSMTTSGPSHRCVQRGGHDMYVMTAGEVITALYP